MNEKTTAAFKMVDEICAGYTGNRKEHVMIQTSLRVIFEALNPPKKIEVPKKKEDEEKNKEE